MRFFELDGKRYEVESCYKCRFSDDETADFCLYPGLDKPLSPLPTLGVHELCPLREVEYNLPQPPLDHRKLFDLDVRGRYIESISNAANRPSRELHLPFQAYRLAWCKEAYSRMAEYFGVTLERMEADEDLAWGTAVLRVPKDWSPEKVGSPDLIPFVPQPEIPDA